jgi:hypothetical protein
MQAWLHSRQIPWKDSAVGLVFSRSNRVEADLRNKMRVYINEWIKFVICAPFPSQWSEHRGVLRSKQVLSYSLKFDADLALDERVLKLANLLSRMSFLEISNRLRFGEIFRNNAHGECLRS